MPSLEILYSIEFEIERLQYTFGKLKWYISHGYKPHIPEKLLMNDSPTNKEIEEAVKSEYNQLVYSIQKDFLQSHWHDAFEQTRPILDRLLPFLHDKYIIHLTKYGTGGSYDYPNIIYANITYWWDKGIVRNILHEITHLAIHPLIEKYKLSHWQKERIVDLITLKLSEKYGRAQEIKKDMGKIDAIFQEFYPDTEKIIMNIARHNQELDSLDKKQ